MTPEQRTLLGISLKALLDVVKAAALTPDVDDIALEYGDESKPQGYLSHLQIQYMNTQGGYQFRMCRLDRLGRPSGSEYSPDPWAIIEKALEAVVQYHRPVLAHPRGAHIQKSEPLTWFLTKLVRSAPTLNSVEEDELEKLFPGIETITL